MAGKTRGCRRTRRCPQRQDVDARVWLAVVAERFGAMDALYPVHHCTDCGRIWSHPQRESIDGMEAKATT